MLKTPSAKRRVPAGPKQPARMLSIKKEVKAWEETLKERLPAVTNASLRLHAVMGVRPGMHILGNQALTVWRMPEPGRDEAGEVGHGQDSQFEPVVPQIVVHPPPEEHEPPVLEPAEALAKRKRQPSDPVPPQLGPSDPVLLQSKPQHRLSHKRSKVDVIDLTHSPSPRNSDPSDIRSHMQVTKPISQPLQGKKSLTRMLDLDTFTPASAPPPNHDHEFDSPATVLRHPIYWTPSLTTTIRSWLAHDDIQSAQVHLTRLTLQVMPENCQTPFHFTPLQTQVFEGSKYDRLKLLRLTLPPAHGGFSSPHSPRDWYILICISQGLSNDGFDSDSSLSEPEDEDEEDLPYWLMAFPVEQVTGVNSVTSVLTPSPQEQDLAILFPMIYGGFGERREVRTTMVLGLEGRVPLLHGRGIGEKFVDGFLRACVEGRGVVEVVSEGRVPVDGT